jgi:hypothetical protein
VCLNKNHNNGGGGEQQASLQRKKKKGALVELGFKKDQTLRPSKLPGAAFAEGPSRSYTAVANRGEVTSDAREN